MAEPPGALVPKAIKAYGIDYAVLSNRDIQAWNNCRFIIVILLTAS